MPQNRATNVEADSTELPTELFTSVSEKRPGKENLHAKEASGQQRLNGHTNGLGVASVCEMGK